MKTLEKIQKLYPVISVHQDEQDEFEYECRVLVEAGYVVSSTSCGFIDSAEYDFCPNYYAIFVRGEKQ